MNTTPEMTSPMRENPLMRLQFFSADWMDQLENHGERRFPGTGVPRCDRPEPHCGEGGFDRVGVRMCIQCSARKESVESSKAYPSNVNCDFRQLGQQDTPPFFSHTPEMSIAQVDLVKTQNPAQAHQGQEAPFRTRIRVILFHNSSIIF